jgi:3'-phosphoadenosine 5'-phosphosulfate synthase
MIKALGRSVRHFSSARRVAPSLIKEMTSAERKEFNSLPAIELDNAE